ncbi:MAG TPA: aminotransferase class IV [Aliidongia sp.]|nr:aminotransferase class IV [Aliidongia sp.]
MTVWLNGGLLAAAAGIDPADRGFTLGDGLFETIRARSGTASHLDRHLRRLRGAAAFLGIPLPWSNAEIEDAIGALMIAEDRGEAALRLTLSRGPGPRGILPPERPAPTLLITAGPLPPAAPPARLIFAAVTRRNELSPLSRLKTLNYLDNILARREAAARGADDAILLNTVGRLAESSIANLFVLKHGVWHTPPVADGALPGIARSLLLEAGAVETPLDPVDLAGAQAAFLSNSLGLRPIASIEGTEIGRADAAIAELAAIIFR